MSRSLRTFSLMTLALLLAGCWPTPTTPTPPGPPIPSPAADLAAAQDLATAARLVSVSPSSVRVSTDTTVLVTGTNLRLDQLQSAVWAFGACQIEAYTYSPVDAGTCRLTLQVGKVPPASCDLSLRIGSTLVAPTLVGAFALVP